MPSFASVTPLFANQDCSGRYIADQHTSFYAYKVHQHPPTELYIYIKRSRETAIESRVPSPALALLIR